MGDGHWKTGNIVSYLRRKIKRMQSNSELIFFLFYINHLLQITAAEQTARRWQYSLSKKSSARGRPSLPIRIEKNSKSYCFRRIFEHFPTIEGQLLAKSFAMQAKNECKNAFAVALLYVLPILFLFFS